MCESEDYIRRIMLNSSYQSYKNKRQNEYTYGNKDFYYYKTKNSQNNSQTIYYHSQGKDSDKEGNETEEGDTKESIMDMEKIRNSIKLDMKNSEEELYNDKNYENLQKENKNLSLLLDNINNKELEYETKINNQKIEYEESINSIKAQHLIQIKEKEEEIKLYN